MSEAKTVAIIGAGPVGLAAAAHVLERGLTPIVLEAGSRLGHAMRQWGHVQMFSPWEYNIDRAAARLLASTGWNSPEPEQYPTGAELVERYLEPLAATNGAARTTSIRRAASPTSAASASTSSRPRAAKPHRSKSAIRTAQGPKSMRADAVIDASGTWSLAESGRRQWSARHRRSAERGQDRLRHARRARQGSRALRRQDNGGAGRGPFRGRHTDRARQARDATAGNQVDLAACAATIPPRHLAAAPTTSSRPAANWGGLRGAGKRGRPDPASKRISRIASGR